MVPGSFLLIFFTLFIYVDAEGNCKITDPSYLDDWKNSDIWIRTSDDVPPDFKIEIATENMKSVSLDHPYMDAKITNNFLTFEMKPEFENFIQNENNLKMNKKLINFICENGEAPPESKYTTLLVTETKNFDPEFEKKNYEFKLSMPLTPSQIIESTAMIVTDFNIDEKLTFSFTGGDAECNKFGFNTVRNNKKYTTKLKTLDHVNLDESITCNIQVEDKRQGVDSAEIVIKVDTENSKVPNPMFKDPIKIVDYAENLNVKLELISTIYKPKAKIVDDNVFSKYFQSKEISNNEIEIELINSIPEEEIGNTNYFVLIVEVEYDKADNTAKTPILVDFNRKTATTTTSTTIPDCTTTIISTTPCDCSTTTSDPGDKSTTTESDTSSCPTCPDCTTTSMQASTCPECPEISTLPGESTTCPECPTTCPTFPDTTLPGESTTCPECPETTLPGEGTTCPECPDTTLPGDGTTCPECPTTCPTFPDTTLPGESTTCPICPGTTLPDEGTTCPECPTTCPTFPDTTLPGESTTCPECPETTLPGESTTCPECPITCPEITTTTCLENPDPTSPGESSSCPSNPECPSTSSDSSTSSLGSTTPSNCDCSTSSPISTCPPWETEPQVRFLKKSSLITLDKGSTGLVDTFKAISDISGEEITYKIKSVEPAGAQKMFEITKTGDVNIKEELDEGEYDISLTATGKQSKNQDEATLFLIIKHKIINCPDDTIQVERLINVNVKENESKKIVASNGNQLDFTTDNDDILDWFEFSKNGDLEARKIDREDPKIKSLLAPQIQIKLRATKKNTLSYKYHFATNTSEYSSTKSQLEYSCLNIRNIDMKPDTMVVLIKVEDVNDNPPIFIEESPLIIGYPEPKLIELIAPPYLVKVTATDEDFGDYAKIKYTTNSKNFIADAENGIIFLANEIKDNTNFKIIAEDNNGNDGNKAELSVKVKILEEKHLSIITMENVAYSEVDDKIKEISSLTKQTVKYLSSTALPKITEEEKKMLKSNEEKLPAVRIILYALDNKNEIISAKDFKEIADDINLGIEINVEEYTAISPNPEEDATGWIAAVSTLSVLLALVIIGALLAFIFYFRPRMMESPSNGYNKHRDSIVTAPIETTMESVTVTTLADRRPTGFPMGFNPKDFDDEDAYEDIKEENETSMEVEDDEEDEVFNENDNTSIKSKSNTSETETKPKGKVGVKFDTNVTEIEIEEF